MSAVGLGRREPCVVCNQPVFLAQRLLVERRLYHRTCFTCARCGTQLSLAGCYQTETDGQFCCETCPDEDDQQTDDDSSLQSAPASIDSIRRKFESNDADDTVKKRNVYNRTASDEEKARNLNKYNDALIAESSAYDESRKELSANSVVSSKALSGFLNSQFDKDSDDEDVVPALPKSLPPVKHLPTQVPTCDVSPDELADAARVSQPLICDSGLVVSARATFVPATSATDADRLVSDLSLKSELIGISPPENKLPDIQKNVSDAPLATSERIVSANLPDDEVEMKSDVSPAAVDDDKPRDVNIDKSHVNQLDTASDLKSENDTESSSALDYVEKNAKIDVAIAKDSQRSSKTPNAFDGWTARGERKTASPEPSDRSLVKMRMKVFESAGQETESRPGRASAQRSNVDQSNFILSKFSLSSENDVARVSSLEPAGETVAPDRIDTPVEVSVTADDKSDSKISDESNYQISLSDVPCNDTMPYIISTINPPAQDITTAPVVDDRFLEITTPDIINTEIKIEDLPDDGDKIVKDTDDNMSSEENTIPILIEDDSVSVKIPEATVVQEDDAIEKKHEDAIPESNAVPEKEEEVISSDVVKDENIDAKDLDDTATVAANENDDRPGLDESNVSSMMDSTLSLSKSVQEEIYPEDLNPFGDDDDEEEDTLAKNKNNPHPQIPKRRSAMPITRHTIARGTHLDLNVERSPPKKVSTNPFGSSSDEDEPVKGNVAVKKKSGQKPPRPPPPAILVNALKSKADTLDSKRLIPAPSINLNPFWSEGDEDNSEEEGHKQMPVPTPRQRLSDGQNPSPMPRYSIGVGPPPSFHSSSSSLASTISRRKKAPAPKPPSSGPPVAAPRKISDAESVDDLHDTSLSSRLSTPYSSMSHISPQVSPRTRKRRPAPLPPAASSTLLESPTLDYSLNHSGPQSLQVPTHTSPIIRGEEISKSSIGLSNSKRVIPVDDFNDGTLDDTFSSEWDGDNSIRDDRKNRLSTESEGLSPINKSTAGQWKRRKGPAPAVPLLQRRAAGPPLAPAALRRELQLLEAQQRGLEKQGVRLEEIIREKCESNDLPEGVIPEPDPETDELVMQLFELVNEKNELFRRQAELMYIRRQQRLEEEYADLEHQIRCLMAQPELNKTDSDKAREEQLIQRLVEVVERRNEVVTSLEMDRLREREEDKSISERMASHRAKLDETNSPMDSPKKKEKKKDKKKWMKRDKAKKLEAKTDSSDVNDADSLKKEKKMKKWFQKTGNS